jgi:polysaccharide export outer membrane protein
MNVLTKTWRMCGLLAVATLLAACASVPSSGPRLSQIESEASQAKDAIGAQTKVRLIDVDMAVASRLKRDFEGKRFADILGSARAKVDTVGPGDVLEITIWEAPPASLFAVTPTDARSGVQVARPATLPEQAVDSQGSISIPFVGAVRASGRTLGEVQSDIAAKLRGKANQPQVSVRLLRNATSDVTVVGEVTQSLRMPLTARGERLLDAVAAAGGPKQPVNKVTVWVTRGSAYNGMPLEDVISDPRQNVPLQPGDVVTLVHQPFTASVLGAISNNREIEFEAKGISLTQALARAGGLQDSRSDPRAVFVFRFDPDTATASSGEKIPTIYRIDLSQAANFLVAQRFPVRDKDIIYVANSPVADLQKLMNILGALLGPAALINAF